MFNPGQRVAQVLYREVSPPLVLFVLTQRLVVTEDTMGGLALFQLGTNRIQRCEVSTILVVLQIPPRSEIDWSCHGRDHEWSFRKYKESIEF